MPISPRAFIGDEADFLSVVFARFDEDDGFEHGVFAFAVAEELFEGLVEFAEDGEVVKDGIGEVEEPFADEGGDEESDDVDDYGGGGDAHAGDVPGLILHGGGKFGFEEDDGEDEATDR